MNHETARELLPWLLNGTLDSTERDELRIHLEDCEACRQELQETRQAMETFQQHVPTGDLVAHAEGRKTELPPEVLDAHLESCPECAEELTLLVGSLHTYGRPRDASESTSPRRTVPAFWRQAALAAALLGIVAFTGWIATWQGLGTPQSQIAATSQTEESGINVPTIDLSPGDLVLRGAEDAPESAEESRPVMLFLNSELSADEGPFTVEVTGADGNLIARAENEPWPDLGVFNFEYQPHHPDQIRIRIASAEGTEETYRFQRVSSDGGS